jgi:glycosyltransferase involved in cell wall biosynthesis
VVRQGLNGYIVPAQNTALLTERVAALLSDGQLLASMREHGRGRAAVVEGGFTSQQMVQRYSQFFQQWLQG